MASIFDLYGIKEVADVVFWTTEEPRVPVLYLDTLKVSTIEETAEQTEARGGKGNPPLIIWDYGKEITLTLEDAVFSMKSMSVMHTHHFGTVDNASKAIDPATAVEKVKRFTTTKEGAIPASAEIPNDAIIYDEFSNVVSRDNIEASKTYLARWTQVVSGSTITITSEDFPGTYYITGDTYARSQATGEDEFFQFEIPLAKVNPEQTITMQADGDPSTFSMTVRVMRPADGVMMKFTKYDLVTQTEYSISRGTDAENQELPVGSQKQLSPVVTPNGAAITWASSNSAVVSVSGGMVSALAETSGTPVVITATLADDSSKSVSYNFTAIQYGITRGEGEEEAQSLAVGDQPKTLSPVVTPDTATIDWTSSDGSKATVEDGVVTAVAATEAGSPIIITATVHEDSTKSVPYSFTITEE